MVGVIDRFADLDHIEDEAEREREMGRRVDAARAKARGEHGEGVTVILIDLEDAEL